MSTTLTVPEQSPEAEDQEERSMFIGVQYKSGYFSPSVPLHFSNIFQSFVDTAILAVPFYMNKTGPLIGGIMYLTYNFLMMTNVRLLFAVAERHNYVGKHLGEVVGKYMGKPGKRFTNILLGVGQAVVFIASVLFAAEFVRYTLCLHLDYCRSMDEFIWLGLFFSILIVLIPNIKIFSIVSFVSSIVIAVALVIIMGFSFVHVHDKRPFSEKIVKFEPRYILSFLSLISYTIEGVGLAFPLRSSYAEKRPPREFTQLYLLCSTVVSILLIIFGTLNYLKFTDDTQPIIFYNYQQKHGFILALETIYAVVLFVSNPLNLFPLFNQAYDSRLFSRLESTGLFSRYVSRLLARVFIVGLCFVACFTGIQFIPFIQISGAFLFNFIGLVLPCIVFIIAFHKTLTKLQFFGVVFLLLVGLTIWISSTSAIVVDLLAHQNPQA